MNAIGVGVINHNTREHLRACLTTILQDAPGEIVVVDNASVDGSLELVRREYAGVRLIANATNRGYGAAANQAIACTSAPHILLLNSDTLLRPGALQALRAYLDHHPCVAMVGPRLVNVDGSLQPSCFPFPTPIHTLVEISGSRRVIRHLPFVRELYPPTSSHSRARPVPWVLGAGLALRRKAVDDVDGFDESFFMYSEEVDLAYRLRRAGWQIHFAPVATIAHVGGASTRQRPAEMARQAIASTAHFYRRHYSHRDLEQFKLVITLGMIAKLVRDAARLFGAHEPPRRARLSADIRTWHSILHDLHCATMVLITPLLQLWMLR